MSRAKITGELNSQFEKVLSDQAMAFVVSLHDRFESERLRLLELRKDVQAQLDKGARPDFLPDTREIRTSDWRIAPVPDEISDRRVEITGPVDRKTIINALNSGAKVFMADFEDAHSPTWQATLEGQINLHEAVRKTIKYKSPEGKSYNLNDQTSVLFVRPRGWHLNEKHVLIDGRPISASLFDFGLFFYHNAHEQIRSGTRPYFYLPKIESHLEARLWNEVFLFSQNALSLPKGTIKATVLIETILAAFEMHEILYELREHSAGLNCGRWDYIFSYIKKFKGRQLFPDRSQVTMTTHFLKSYSHLLIQTCHRRGAHAIGGMAAYIPNRNDQSANETALKKVAEDKEREVEAGHDGTWVAHPGLIEIARQVFDRKMTEPNQIKNKREDVQVSANDLLAPVQGSISEAGLKLNINVSLWYTEAWLRGLGCVPLHGLMEDAATAEISRAQVWQWIHSEARLSDGTQVTLARAREILNAELTEAKIKFGPEFSDRRFNTAAQILELIFADKSFRDFLTIEAYTLLK